MLYCRSHRVRFRHQLQRRQQQSSRMICTSLEDQSMEFTQMLSTNWICNHSSKFSLGIMFFTSLEDQSIEFTQMLSTNSICSHSSKFSSGTMFFTSLEDQSMEFTQMVSTNSVCSHSSKFFEGLWSEHLRRISQWSLLKCYQQTRSAITQVSLPV